MIDAVPDRSWIFALEENEHAQKFMAELKAELDRQLASHIAQKGTAEAPELQRRLGVIEGLKIALDMPEKLKTTKSRRT